MVADTPAARSVLAHFQWVDGDAGTWNMLRDPSSLRTIAAELATLCAEDAPDVIVGIEARGFVVAPLVAMALDVGFFSDPQGRFDVPWADDERGDRP